MSRKVRRRKIAEKDWPEFRELWADRNMQVSDIAFRFGVCVSYLYDNAEKMGGVSRNRKGVKVAPKEEVTEAEVEQRKAQVWQRHLDDLKHDRISYRTKEHVISRECYVLRQDSRGLVISTSTTNN